MNFVKSLLCVLQKANASNNRHNEIIAGADAIDYTTAYRAIHLENTIESIIYRVI
jgi:hypothetical protein